MNFDEWFKSLYVKNGFVSSKEELQTAWDAAIDEAVKVADNPPCSYSSVLQSKGGSHAAACIANKIKELKQ